MSVRVGDVLKQGRYEPQRVFWRQGKTLVVWCCFKLLYHVKILAQGLKPPAPAIPPLPPSPTTPCGYPPPRLAAPSAAITSRLPRAPIPSEARRPLLRRARPPLPPLPGTARAHPTLPLAGLRPTPAPAPSPLPPTSHTLGPTPRDVHNHLWSRSSWTMEATLCLH